MSKNLTKDSLPLFVVPGMPRAGTTYLYHNLQKHPQIFLPFRKEIDYFNAIYHHRGKDWYHRLFRGIKPNQIAGDLSPACWFDPDAIQYIKEYDENVKVILSLRDPAEFIVSLYAQKLTSNYDVPKKIEDFVRNGYFSKLTKEGGGVRFRFEDGVYTETIQKYIEAFKGNLLIYDFKFFRKYNLKTLSLIEEFLGLDHWFNEQNYDPLRINESDRRNIKIVNFIFTREWLRDWVERFVPRLAAMKARGFLDRLSVRTDPNTNELLTHKKESIERVRDMIPNDCYYYNKIFEKKQVVSEDFSGF